MKKIIPLVFLTAIFLVACGSKDTPDTLVDTALDKNIFEQATSSGNIKQCDSILDGKLKMQCQDIVDSFRLTAQAKQNLDMNICNKITIERAKEDCINQVGNGLELKNADKEVLEISQSAMEKSDESLCDQIRDENQKASCKFNILSNKAYAKKDPSICEGIGIKDMVEQCKAYYEK